MEHKKERVEALAVHRQKLEEFLVGLGLFEALTNGELKCHVCGMQVSLDNIGLIVPSGEEILLCCSVARCIHEIKEIQTRGSGNEI